MFGLRRIPVDRSYLRVGILSIDALAIFGIVLGYSLGRLHSILNIWRQPKRASRNSDSVKSRDEEFSEMLSPRSPDDGKGRSSHNWGDIQLVEELSHMRDLTGEEDQAQVDAQMDFLISQYTQEMALPEDPDEVVDQMARQATMRRRHSSTSVGPSPLTSVVLDSVEVKQLFENALDWNFDVIHLAGLPEIAGQPLVATGAHLADRCHMCSKIPVSMLGEGVTHSLLRSRILAFFSEIESMYLQVPYHNAIHATDVMQTMNVFFEMDFFESLAKERLGSRLICLMAAACHDVAHTGQTNAYHVATSSDLALLYNDISPLENMHVSKAFQLMRDQPKADWLGSFAHEHTNPETGKTWNIFTRMRRYLVAMILGTDNAKHAENVTTLKDWVAQGERRADPHAGVEWQLFALQTALHAADISNPSKRPDISMTWSSRVLEEFWAQGDLEKKELGVVSMPMFDREQINVPLSQIGFIQFIVLGLYEPLVELSPELQEHLEQLKRNKKYWEDRQSRGLTTFPPRIEWAHE